MDPFPQALDRIRELGREGRYDEALGLCEKLARHSPDNTEVLFLAGALRHALGQNEQAIRLWRRAVELDPTHDRAAGCLAKLEFDSTLEGGALGPGRDKAEGLFEEGGEDEERLDPRCLLARAGAFVIDAVLISAVGVYAAMLLHPAWLFLIACLYFAGFESSRARSTPGKRLMGIAVVYEDGERISAVAGVARFLGKGVSTLFFLLGHLIAVFSSERRTFHDRLVGTRVVRSGPEHPLQAALVTLGGASAIWLGISLGVVEPPRPASRAASTPGEETVALPKQVGEAVQAGPFEMRDEGTAYVFTMELPGADISSLNSQWVNGQVMVSGRVAGATGDFHYSVPVPVAADAEGVQHSYLNGVLSVIVPKLF